MGKSKKELDRDMMFRKIMPALADNPFSTPVTEVSTADALDALLRGDTMPPLPAAPEPLPTASAPQVADAPEIAAPPAISAALEEAQAPPTDLRPPSRPRTALPTPPEEAPPDDDLSVLRARLFARSGTAGNEQVCTINLMESLVLQYLDEVIQRFNCCRCDRCRRDIAACALNHLPAQYIVADPGNMEQMAQKVPKKLIYDALVKAVLQVRFSPRH